MIINNRSRGRVLTRSVRKQTAMHRLRDKHTYSDACNDAECIIARARLVIVLSRSVKCDSDVFATESHQESNY